MRPIRFFLNTSYSGPQAPFFMADDLGYFAEAGLEVTFTEGESLAYAVPVLAAGGYDAAYGDLNTLIEMEAAARPTPLAVFAMHNRSPYTVAVNMDGPIHKPADLEGRSLVSHPEDAAWKFFPEFCLATGIDVNKVSVEPSDLGHDEMVVLMREGRWDGIFGFVNTIRAHTVEAGLDPDLVLRHLEWRNHLPALYGGAVMVTREIATRQPEVVRGLVAAINKGLKAAIADPDAAIAAVQRRDPKIDVKANRQRLLGTLGLEMAHAESAVLGIGDADDARLAEVARLVAGAKGLPNIPTPAQVFDRSFLPPMAERVTSLAKP